MLSYVKNGGENAFIQTVFGVVNFRFRKETYILHVGNSETNTEIRHFTRRLNLQLQLMANAVTKRLILKHSTL